MINCSLASRAMLPARELALALRRECPIDPSQDDSENINVQMLPDASQSKVEDASLRVRLLNLNIPRNDSVIPHLHSKSDGIWNPLENTPLGTS